MATEWDDEPLPEGLRDAARGYNQPPAAPRDQMWWAISAARQRRRAVRRIARRVYWGLALAATLILGIGIGRLAFSGARSPVAVIAPAPLGSSTAYRVAAGQYLSRTEVLLTDFSAESRKGRLDPRFVVSARDLLSTTRLMLDSPAADDPQLKVLLQDLELVLAQVTQLPEKPRQKSEMDLINQGLTQRGVLARLRAATPAAGAPTRAQGVL